MNETKLRTLAQLEEFLAARDQNTVVARQYTEYEGTSHFTVTASSAKIAIWKVNLQPFKGEVP